MNTTLIRILDAIEEVPKLVLLLQRNEKMFVGIALERHRAGKKYHCVYIGINRQQYKALIKDHEFADRASFLGISGAYLDVKKAICDKLLLEQPTHYVGEVTPEGHSLEACLIALSDVVWDQLESVNAA